jgi:hypothetical protein
MALLHREVNGTPIVKLKGKSHRDQRDHDYHPAK